MTKQVLTDEQRAKIVRKHVVHGSWAFDCAMRVAHEVEAPILAQQAQAEPVAKYDDTLLPFLALMRAELHANAGKGDRPGWLTMTREQAVLEIYHHAAKLAKAMRDDDPASVREYAADVANMAMMALDVAGYLPENATPPTAQQVQRDATAEEEELFRTAAELSSKKIASGRFK